MSACAASNALAQAVDVHANLCDAARMPLQPQQLLACAHVKQAHAPAVAAGRQQVWLLGVEGQAADDACRGGGKGSAGKMAVNVWWGAR